MSDLPLLEVAHLTKQFAGNLALDDVSFDVQPGQILALLGQNGSGKSTLVKSLAGVYRPDRGSITLPRSGGAGSHGTSMHFIHQDLGLVPALSTVENLDLGRAVSRRGVLVPLRRKLERRAAHELIARFGVDFDVTQPVGTLSPAEKAIVAIARAMNGWTSSENILVLDEPTAALHRDEVVRLFAAVRRIAAEGAGVLFISHRLDEVFELAERVLVLRDGRLVADAQVADIDESRLVEMIVGHRVIASDTADATDRESVVMTGRGLGGRAITEIDFDIHAGEIVGVSGILGSGREHLSGLIFGAVERTSGEVTVDGQALKADSPTAAIKAGIGFIPSDRHGEGMIGTLACRENLTLPQLRSLRDGIFRIRRREERRQAADWFTRLEVRPFDPEQKIGLLSGGNQQKIVIGKWLRTNPRVILLDEPTQGVDVGAKEAIYEVITAAAREGAAVVVSSSDNKEIERLCGRVLVFRDGMIATELSGAEATEERLVREGLGIRGPVSTIPTTSGALA